MGSTADHLLEVLQASIPALGFTQKGVEERLGLSQGYLSRLFGGRLEFKVDHVEQIAGAIQIDPREIFRLAFPPFKGELSAGGQLLRERLGGAAPEPAPAAGSELERGIESIVERVLERRSHEAGAKSPAEAERLGEGDPR